MESKEECWKLAIHAAIMFLLSAYGLALFETLTLPGVSALKNPTRFHGQIPVEISYLTRLVSLDLSNQGSCYLRYYTILDPYYGRYNYYELHPELEQPLKLEKPNFKTLIKNLRFLTELYLDGVDISTQSAKWCETTSLVLSNLLVLSLSNCGMKGPLCSSLSRLSFLSKLILDGNPISYLPPNFLVNSSRLVSLSLIACNLNGHFPTGIHLLPKIQSIDISGNDQLMGQLPEFPANNALQSLLLYFTNFSGKLPEPIELNLRSCNISAFPDFIKIQDKLVDLDLSNNHIHGVVPNWLWKSNLSRLPLSDLNFSFSLLRKLYLESCNISSFPEFLKSQENLEYLKLSNNKISGAIPNWVWKKSLRYLLLANNHLSTLDQLLPNQSSISSQDSLYFVASYNNLSGPIPNWLCNMSQLDSFDASYNNFNGPIPNCLGNMSALSWLGLQRNNFSGMLPKFLKATQLQFLKVSENRLVGKLPRSLAKCTQLMVLDVGSNMINDTFPFWLEKLTYLMVLILRENRFYGQIKHLKHKSVFPTLDALDIASNQFSGELSIDFLHATQLRSLKIGGNKLERKLSRSLANCTALEVI
ncbi:receptor-like protein 41 [Gossypium hirsutum]|uniref:Receptor-like protein 41 n=1 Tax=Gossypium hirsutum TaxID=3635 RepID=A0A1U8MM43_GOSHI|nr:receptor-like protein 41 [Gossypium hirsutum]